MKRGIVFLVCVLVFGTGSRAQDAAARLEPLPMDSTVRYGQLSNGLTYYIRYNNNPRERAYFYLAQRVGSVQEEESQRGLAHFLEHMCFNGSDHFEGNGIIDFCRRIGVRFGQDLNAYTSIDRTVYNIDNVPTTDRENIDSCLYILYDWANGLTLSEEEIDKERGVVHEEWRLSNDGMMRIFERRLPDLMPGSRYADRLPIGLMSVIDSFEYGELRDYYERWYRPDLQGVVVCGDVDVDYIEQRIEEIFGAIPAQTDGEPLVYYAVPDNDEPIIVCDKDKEVSQPMVLVARKHDALSRDLRPTVAGVLMDLVSTAMVQMMGYRFEELMENPDAPYLFIGMDDGEFLLTRSVESFNFYVIPREGQTREAVGALLEELERLGRYGFGEDEYERFKLDFGSALEQALLARATVKTSTLVDECVEHFLENESLADYGYENGLYGELLNQLPLESINDYAATVVGEGDTNVVVLAAFPDKEEYVLPEEGELREWLSEARSADVEPYVMEPLDLALLEREPMAGSLARPLGTDALGYKGVELSNGVKLYYKQTDFEENEVRLLAVSKGGSAMVGDEDIDNIEMFNRVMRGNGVGRFSGVELSKALTGKQARLGIGLGRTTEYMRGQAAPRDLATLMQLVYLHFTELYNDTLNYQTTMRSTAQSLANRGADPMTPLMDSLTVCPYGGHVRYQPLTVERLANVDYDRLREIYGERFGNAADFEFIVTGNFDEDSLKMLAARYLAALPAGGEKEAFGDDGARLWEGASRSDIFSKMETPSGYVVEMWHAGVKQTPVNRMAVQALEGLLEEEYLATIREEHSLAYTVGVTAGIKMLPEPYVSVMVDCPVKPEGAEQALELIDEGLRRMAKEGPKPEALAKVKEQMAKVAEMKMRDNAFYESAEEQWLLYGIDVATGWREALEKLTVDDVRKMAARVVKGGNKYDFILLPE